MKDEVLGFFAHVFTMIAIFALAVGFGIGADMVADERTADLKSQLEKCEAQNAN